MICNPLTLFQVVGAYSTTHSGEHTRQRNVFFVRCASPKWWSNFRVISLLRFMKCLNYMVYFLTLQKSWNGPNCYTRRYIIQHGTKYVYEVLHSYKKEPASNSSSIYLVYHGALYQHSAASHPGGWEHGSRGLPWPRRRTVDAITWRIYLSGRVKPRPRCRLNQTRVSLNVVHVNLYSDVPGTSISYLYWYVAEGRLRNILHAHRYMS